MNETVARANTKEAQLKRAIAAATASGLVVREIVIEPRRIKLVTGPALPESKTPAEDASDAEAACDRAFGIGYD